MCHAAADDVAEAFQEILGECDEAHEGRGLQDRARRSQRGNPVAEVQRKEVTPDFLAETEAADDRQHRQSGAVQTKPLGEGFLALRGRDVVHAAFFVGSRQPRPHWGSKRLRANLNYPIVGENRRSTVVLRYETCRLPNCAANSGSSTPP